MVIWWENQLQYGLDRYIASGKRLQKTMGNHHFLMGKINYMLLFFNSKLLVYQMVNAPLNLAFSSGIKCNGRHFHGHVLLPEDTFPISQVKNLLDVTWQRSSLFRLFCLSFLFWNFRFCHSDVSMKVAFGEPFGSNHLRSYLGSRGILLNIKHCFLLRNSCVFLGAVFVSPNNSSVVASPWVSKKDMNMSTCPRICVHFVSCFGFSTLLIVEKGSSLYRWRNTPW